MKKMIVVGAGILGASTAYHLAKAGVNVTIIDREDRGQATRAAAGIICPWVSQRRNKAWYTLAKNGARFYPNLISELEKNRTVKTGYTRVGALCVHTEEKKLDEIERRTLLRREEAPEIGEITRLSSMETQKRCPILSERYGSIFVSGAARVDGQSLRQALIQAAIAFGATFIQADAQLIFQNTQVTGVKVNDQKIFADKVLITAGAWVKELLQPLGIKCLVKPQKAQIVHLEIAEKGTELWPVVMPPFNKYLLAFENGRIVIGSTYEDGVGFDLRMTASGVHEILDKAFQIAPGLLHSTIKEIKVGFRPVTPNFSPIIGEVPSIQGIFVANGLGASGLTVGPYLGSELAKLVLGKVLEIDLAQYDVKQAIQ